MGSMNAAVFPDPVTALPRISRPVRANGTTAACIGVGLSYPKSCRLIEGGENPLKMERKPKGNGTKPHLTSAQKRP